MLYQIVLGPPCQILCLNVTFSLAAGHQKIWTVTLKRAKHIFYITFAKVAPETKFVLKLV